METSNSIQSGDTGTTFWNTTPTFGTPPHRAPALQRKHQPARVGVLVQLSGTQSHRAAGQPSRPRATSYMVRILVQPLEHHPTEPQGQTANVGILGHFWMAVGTQAKHVDKSIDTPLRARPTDTPPPPAVFFTPLSACLEQNMSCHAHPAVNFYSFFNGLGPLPPGRPRPSRPKGSGHAHHPSRPGVILTFL